MRADALRDDLEQGAIESFLAASRLAATGRRLLRMFPTHAGLVEAFARLRARGFLPPPKAILPTVDPARVLARWPAEDRATWAKDLVSLPDPAADLPLAWATLELLARVPGEESRALELATRLEKRGADPRRLALIRFRLASGDWGQRLQPLRAHAASGALAEGLRMAASDVIARSERLGARWIVPVADGVGLANVALAKLRRPALALEHEKVFDWLTQAGPAPFLGDAEAADQRGDVALGAELLAQALERHGFEGEAERVFSARRALLLDDLPRPWHFPLPQPHAPEPPRTEWAKRLRHDPEPALLEALGDRAAAAEAYLARGEVYQGLRFVDVLGEARLRDALAARPVPAGADDEQAIATNPDARAYALARYALTPPGFDKFIQALRLAAAGLIQLPSNIPAQPTEALFPDDPHHPESRLAAATDLMAAGNMGAAANVLAALLRKFDEATSPRLPVVVAQALEEEEPPEELVAAAEKAVARLVPALRDNPTAAFQLHDALLARAHDTSLADTDRLLALEAWLGIWRATGTPPDPASLESLRRDEPELLVVAALRLAGASPLTLALKRFMASHPASVTTPEDFSAALLAPPT